MFVKLAKTGEDIAGFRVIYPENSLNEFSCFLLHAVWDRLMRQCVDNISGFYRELQGGCELLRLEQGLVMMLRYNRLQGEMILKVSRQGERERMASYRLANGAIVFWAFDLPPQAVKRRLDIRIGVNQVFAQPGTWLSVHPQVDANELLCEFDCPKRLSIYKIKNLKNYRFLCLESEVSQVANRIDTIYRYLLSSELIPNDLKKVKGKVLHNLIESTARASPHPFSHLKSAASYSRSDIIY